MKTRNLFLAALLALGLVSLPAAAHAVNILVDVSFNVSGTVATNISESSGLTLVTAGATDTTVTFLVHLSASTAGVEVYDTFMAGDAGFSTNIDLGEITPSSSTDLSGLGFTLFDGLTDQGGFFQISTPAGSVTTTNLYTITYTLGTIVNDGIADWYAVTDVIDASGDIANPAENELNIRINQAATVLPEPATLLLLGSGLAGLAGFGRRKLLG